MFSLRSVCLSLCLSVCPSDNWKSCERILTKFLGRIGHGPGTNEFNFIDDPDHRPDQRVRSPKSGFTGLSKKLPPDFDEILWRAGDQLITFWWRSASLSGSGVRSGSRSGSGKNCHVVNTQNRRPAKNHSAVLLCWRSAEVCALRASSYWSNSATLQESIVVI